MTSKSQQEIEQSAGTPDPRADETPDPLASLATPEELDEPARETDPRIKTFVENGLKLTQAKPRKWFRVILPDAAEVKRVAKEAKAYARQAGYSFRQSAKDKNGNPWPEGHLVYRVTAKVQREADTGSAE